MAGTVRRHQAFGGYACQYCGGQHIKWPPICLREPVAPRVGPTPEVRNSVPPVYDPACPLVRSRLQEELSQNRWYAAELHEQSRAALITGAARMLGLITG